MKAVKTVKAARTLISVILITVNLMFMTGCWNYREIDKLAIVVGVAIDKGTTERYKLTVEVARTTGGKETKTLSKVVSTEGKTVFDAARNAISVTGDRLYWSHSKIIILSKEIAAEGFTHIMDWYTRDSETREDVYIMVSEGATAAEILTGQTVVESIKSIELSDMLKSQESLSKAPIMDVLEFDIQSKTKEFSTIIPTVRLKKADDKTVPQILGTAIIKNDKLAGFLGGEETKYLLFIRNEVKGGVLVEMPKDGGTTPVSLEIFKSKTKTKPVVNGKDIEINLNVDVTVAIDEIDGSRNYIDEDGRKKLEQISETALKQQIEALIKKVQKEFDADIFKFGLELRNNDINAWDNMSENWEEIFKDLKVKVKTRVHIKNSATLAKSFEKGD
ncbi:MAG TPA: Ger(x)C family spore germination protein [Clostridia bacterium]|nr:Ger(x)C family spore germination protein [Clostridia bacterium]